MNIAPDSERASGAPTERKHDNMTASTDFYDRHIRRRQSTGSGRENQAGHRTRPVLRVA
jgi:hypothetical protein